MNARDAAKQVFLRGLFCRRHNNIYEFHHVTAHPALDLSARKLDTQAFYAFVERHGPYLPLGEIIERTVYDRSAAITFDDGLEDVYSIAYPFLRERGIPFTVFALSGKLGLPGYITEAQLLEFARDPLVTVGSHGVDHTDLSLADESVQRREFFESKRRLEELTGRPCPYFAYPFGRYSELSPRLAAEAGYERGFAVKGRPLLRGNHGDPFTIPRLSVDDDTLRFYDPS